MSARLAQRMMDHAAAVMPAERKDWAEAMRAEFSATTTDREALAWASGCVWASYRERIQPMDVLVKSLVRAAAVWLVLFAFVCLLVLLDPRPGRDPELWKLARLLTEFYGGMFATLWVCELLIARFWTVSNKIFKKTLLRAAVLWLWPLGECVYRMSRFFMDSHEQQLIAPVFWEWLRLWLWNWATHYPVMFVAIFVPLLICELLIARFWRLHPDPAV